MRMPRWCLELARFARVTDEDIDNTMRVTPIAAKMRKAAMVRVHHRN
jgi:hypothetical protein